MQRPAGAPHGAVLLVGTLAAIYLVSQFLRNSVGVIAPDLAREIGLNAAEIGLLSSAFFFAFAAAQIPLGIALDRYGAKRCMLLCAAIAFLGTLAFAVATTPAGLVTARILMGLGSSCWRRSRCMPGGSRPNSSRCSPASRSVSARSARCS